MRRAGGFPEETDTDAQSVKMYAVAEVVSAVREEKLVLREEGP